MAQERDMKRAWKRHNVGFKAKVAVASMKGNRTVAELASECGVHPNQIYNGKKQLLDGAASVFEAGGSAGRPAGEGEADGLYRQIGRLKVEAGGCAVGLGRASRMTSLSAGRGCGGRA